MGLYRPRSPAGATDGWRRLRTPAFVEGAPCPLDEALRERGALVASRMAMLQVPPDASDPTV